MPPPRFKTEEQHNGFARPFNRYAADWRTMEGMRERGNEGTRGDMVELDKWTFEA